MKRKPYYEAQIKVSYAKYLTAINIGEDDIAAVEFAKYEDYSKMLEQLNDEQK